MTSDQKTRVEVPSGHGKRWWSGLTAEQKRAVIYPKLVAGGTNPGLARELGITPNAIASKRHVWNKAGKPDSYIAVMLGDVASTAHQKETVVRTKTEKPKAETPVPKPIGKTPSSIASANKPLRGLFADPPSRPKLTGNELLMCTHEDPKDGKRCPNRWVNEKTLRCQLHPK